MSAPPPVNLGEELKDAFKPVNTWVSNGIAWLDDLQSFYRERAAIEKEYAGKLNALSKRFHEKKSRKSASLTVGDTPQMTPGSLESASLTTWTTILNTTELLATEHDTLSNSLTTEVADTLKSLSTRYDDYRKRHESLAQKLLSERDGVYSDLNKCKSKYDSECKDVEEKRQKVDKSYDSSKTKAQKSYQNELVEMNNVKNTYILQIAAANRHKQRYFHEDLPDIINSLQDLNETRVAKVNGLWTLGTELENKCHQNSIELLNTQLSEITRNLPVLDSGIFSQHNVGGWVEPVDFVFEPSPIWHDNPDLVIDEPAQIYLRNILAKSRNNSKMLKVEVEKRGKDIVQLSERWDAVKMNESEVQKEIDIARALLYQKEQILPHAYQLLTCEVEIDVVLNAVGDVARGTQSHNFKSTSFKIPTDCDLCGERIWGLTSKGFTCSDCGYSCHAKCEMKVPAACPGVLDKAAKKALKEENKVSLKTASSELDLPGEGLTRSVTVTSTTSTLAPRGTGAKLTKSPSISGASVTSTAPTTAAPSLVPSVATTTAPTRRVIAPPPERYIAPPPVEDSPPGSPASSRPTSSRDGGESGKMLYTFTATGDGEVTVTEGTAITIIEDDGGWMQVRLANGEEGIVPTSYVQKIEKKSRGPPPPVRPRGMKKPEKKVKALYAYEAGGDDEASMAEGEEFVVIERDVGGWVKVKTRFGEGLVPGTYVTDV
ncbi:hypothetical protein FPQ18DRAFT_349328 [Pyronema domesticum]|nr:hypothetical protein FPQ18DRAFT_349328 [Pyronema domesticum]